VNQALSSAQLLTKDMLHQVQAKALASGNPMVTELQEMLGLSNQDCVDLLASRVGFSSLHMGDFELMEAAQEHLTFTEMLRYECILLSDSVLGFCLVISNPFDQKLQRWADGRIKVKFETFLAHRSDITAWLAKKESGLKAMESLVGSDGSSQGKDRAVEELSYRGISEDASPVIKFVNSTVFDALRANASDIHLETTPGGMAIKYRIDGVMTSVGNISTAELAEQTVSRIKVMSELDISERRIPQDGRFRVRLQGRLIDLRVSIIPSINGEDAVLRILDKQALSDQMKGLQLTSLGFNEATAAQLRHMASEPYGMMLVTGPTGSGKTTTLYAAISEINHGTEKIITIEDPVEYQLPGVLQIPVNEKKGLTFARGLRSILRHDPDKIMVGEIRDAETAQIAIQSALTGHLVFTTVHANNVFDVIGRFMHMGVDMYSLVSALNGVLAQRLLRVNCVHCVEEMTPDDELLAISGLTREEVQDWTFKAGKGCGHCRGSGFKGRNAIAEVLTLNDEIRELIIARAPIRKLKEAAYANGTRYLRKSALDLVRSGETTLTEINRVTFVD
jgi:general secretion pathway protein E